MNKKYEICQRCIMDTTDPDIIFDSNNVCNHCKTYEERVTEEIHTGPKGQEELERIVEKIKKMGKSRDYDCIAGVSGGVDSTTALYHAKKLGLRPLAVHLDNGWNSELAVDNIQRVLEKLQIDLYTHVMDWEEFRDLQLAFLKASVANWEIPTDHAINALLLQTAAKHGIRYIIGGGNVATEGILPKAWGYYNADLKHINALYHQFGSGRSLKSYPKISLFKWFYYTYFKKIRIFRLLNYVDYQKTTAVKMLQENVGYRPYVSKHYESVFTRFFQGHYLPVKFGYDKRRAHLSTLIMAGDISREQALAEMEKSPYAALNLEEDLDYVVKKLGLTRQEFEAYMAAPVKSHLEYPSDVFFFEGLRNLKRAFRNFATSI
jgi:N-acetyl sugar amidotransferase